MGQETASVSGSERTHHSEYSNPEEESQQTVSTAVSKEEAFGLLRNHRRRAVLHYLLEHGEEASLRELVEYVTAEEYGIDPGEISPDQYKRVYTALYQLHLPRMTEFGVIDFDRDAGRVTLGETAPTVERYLPRDDGSRFAGVEVTVAALVVPLVAVGVVGLGPFGAVPLLMWAWLTILALFGLGIFQLFK